MAMTALISCFVFMTFACFIDCEKSMSEDANSGCQMKPTDVCGCIDTSGSVGEKNFETYIKTYNNEFVEELNPSKNGHWLQLHSFGTSVTGRDKWIKNKKSALKEVAEIKYHDSTTALHKCVTLCNSVLINNERSQKKYPKVLFVQSDGNATRIDATEKAFASAKANGIVVVTQPYSEESNEKALRSAAYDERYNVKKMMFSPGWESAVHEAIEILCQASKQAVTIKK